MNDLAHIARRTALTASAIVVFSVLASAAMAQNGASTASPRAKRFAYPDTHRSDHVDTYHGVTVGDPYRWLEDPDSQETRAWIAAQNRTTFGYLESLPRRRQLKQRLSELWNYERYSIPRVQGGRYFFQRNDGLQNQPILYVADRLDATPRVLLDPNRLASDGTTALSGWRVSRDGKLLAYGLAKGGSDWRTWQVRDVQTGRDLSDKLQWVKFSDVAWASDHSGFYYSRYDEPTSGREFTAANYFQKLYFHRLGDPQSKDTLVYQRPDEKEWAFDGQVTEDGCYLVIRVWRGTATKSQIFYKDVRDPGSSVVELISGFDASYSLVGNDDSVLWLQTDLDAPLGRMIAVDLKNPSREHWKTLIPESTDVLGGINVVGDHFIAQYLHDATALVRLFDLQGQKVRDVELPGPGTVEGFDGWRTDRETFYSFSSYTTPATIYRYDLASGKSTVFRTPNVRFQTTDYAMKQVFYTSADGTRIPMMLAYRRGVTPTGNHPTLLHGYGGFNISLTPAFNVTNLVWLEMGGILAVPNLRGGGEYGRVWHEAGMQQHKHRVFDDFVAAAQWLIDNKYTSSEKLAMSGRSNGGLLVGAVMTRRPDLFAAAMPGVGVLDMLRYHRFTIGWAWVPEYGSADDPDDFRNLMSYSPLHNLKPGTCYPATLITTADHDDRVVPAHSFKFAAALQAAHRGDPPVMIRIETRAGHGAGTPTTKLIDAAADSLTFLAAALKM